MNLSQRKQFIEYFGKRLESLDYCYLTFENKIDDERKELNEGSKDLTTFDPILSTFRNCMLIGTCTLIEDVLLQMGTDITTDFKIMAKKVKGPNGESQSKIRQYLRVLGSQLTIDFTPINHDLQLIDDIVKIRNAITHDWGKIDSCSDSDALREIISRRNWAQETPEGYIFLNDEAYADATEPVVSLVQHILDSLTIDTAKNSSER